MRVLYVTTTAPYGQGEAYVVTEMQEVLRQGHDLMIIPRSLKPMLHDSCDELVRCTAQHSIFSWAILLTLLVCFMRYPLRVIKSFSLLFNSRSWQILLKNLAVFPKGCWLAFQVQNFKPDFIHVHWGGTTATMTMIAAELTGVPWIMTLHRWDISEDNLLCVKTKKAHLTRIISQRGYQELLEICSQLDVNKLHVIHMGVNIPKQIVSYSKKPTSFRLIVIGNLYQVKGHIYLLHALHALKEKGIKFHLDIVGRGHLESLLQQECAFLGLEDNVKFQGLIPHKELLHRMSLNEWDACVLPSIISNDGAQEGIPVSLMEAMSYGLPTISTKTGAIPELLSENAGILVPERDPIALADAILRLEADTGLREQIGMRGRSRVLSEFNVETIVKNINHLMRDK